jgi:hypothetical protein
MAGKYSTYIQRSLDRSELTSYCITEDCLVKYVVSYSVVANTNSVALNSGRLIFLYARLNNFSTVSKP